MCPFCHFLMAVALRLRIPCKGKREQAGRVCVCLYLDYPAGYLQVEQSSKQTCLHVWLWLGSPASCQIVVKLKFVYSCEARISHRTHCQWQQREAGSRHQVQWQAGGVEVGACSRRSHCEDPKKAKAEVDQLSSIDGLSSGQVSHTGSWRRWYKHTSTHTLIHTQTYTHRSSCRTSVDFIDFYGSVAQCSPNTSSFPSPAMTLTRTLQLGHRHSSPGGGARGSGVTQVGGRSAATQPFAKHFHFMLLLPSPLPLAVICRHFVGRSKMSCYFWPNMPHFYLCMLQPTVLPLPLIFVVPLPGLSQS